MKMRELRLKEPRGTYKAQRLLASQEAEEFAESSRSKKCPELYLLYVYAVKALKHAESICLMSRRKEHGSAQDFVLEEVRLAEYVQKLKDYPSLMDHLQQWPKNPGIAIAYFAGRSALEVIIQFTRTITSAIVFGRGETACRGATSYDTLQVSPECNPRFAVWQERAITELCEKTIPKPDVWPSPADIHKECWQVLLKLEDEYNKVKKEVKSNSRKVFYSWQSDLPNSTNRGFIQKALENAAKAIRNDDSIKVEPVIDRDTQGVPGSPDIPSVIFGKIEQSQMFVCDVSIINKSSGFRETPNPNVLVELGYAIKTLGLERIVMVMNTAFGEPKLLPFDLSQKRVVPYDMPERSDDRTRERNALKSKLEKALRSILSSADLHIRNRPTLEDAEVSLCIHHSNRDCCGSFVAFNPSSNPCDITDITITDVENTISLPKLNLVSLKNHPCHGKVRDMDQKLPLSIPLGRHRVYFRTEEVTELYRGLLPKAIIIQISFNKSKLEQQTLNKGDTHHYS